MEEGHHPVNVTDVKALADGIRQNVARAIVGQDEAVQLMLIALFSAGHILLEGPPGTAKTFLAQCFARALGLDFGRIQFTPDLMPGDILGSNLFNFQTSQFTLTRGPIFCELLLSDEINRTPPKTQAALLEAMQERQVTVEGQTFTLARPFHVLATANPVEYEGTYPLPEAQLDRFLMRVSFGYPTESEEVDVLRNRIARQREEVSLDPITDAAGLLAMQDAVETVTVDDTVAAYCVALATATREHQHSLLGASPRGSLALMLVGRAHAVQRGRDYHTPEDVKAVATQVLAHRITVKPELWMSNVTGRSVVDSVLATVPTPLAREARPS
jgi:MoxR-like ATPase